MPLRGNSWSMRWTTAARSSHCGGADSLRCVEDRLGFRNCAISTPSASASRTCLSLGRVASGAGIYAGLGRAQTRQCGIGSLPPRVASHAGGSLRSATAPSRPTGRGRRTRRREDRMRSLRGRLDDGGCGERSDPMDAHAGLERRRAGRCAGIPRLSSRQRSKSWWSAPVPAPAEKPGNQSMEGHEPVARALTLLRWVGEAELLPAARCAAAAGDGSSGRSIATSPPFRFRPPKAWFRHRGNRSPQRRSFLDRWTTQIVWLGGIVRTAMTISTVPGLPEWATPAEIWLPGDRDLVLSTPEICAA